MSHSKLNHVFARVEDFETRYCVLLNQSSQGTVLRYFFRAVSRLGDGVFWYTLILCLAYVHQEANGVNQSLHILLTGITGVAIYKFLKERLVRERPYIRSANIIQAAPALDRYSFPSGHTMHAVCFSILFSYYLAEINSLVWGFTILVAMSRVILGLHYPTDVAAGALLGSALALLSLLLVL